MKKIYIRYFSTASLVLAVILAILFVVIFISGFRNLHNMETFYEQYIISEKAAHKLQKGSDILTEQVRLYVMTGEKKYIDGYFEEVNVTQNRNNAVAELKVYFSDTKLTAELEAALSDSTELMERELYAMKLVSAVFDVPEDSLPDELVSVNLSAKDIAASDSQKLEKARRLVSDNSYQNAKNKITDNVNRCMNDLVSISKNHQEKSSAAFLKFYILQEIELIFLILFLIAGSIVVRKHVVKPLISYNESIEHDETVPVIGAAELQSLAETYNRVFEENQAAQKLFRHEAEHDALSGLLNKGSFDKILSLYEKEISSYALILVDIDNFKNFNDTFGHTTGDAVIRKTATKLNATFRSSDYIFRIGGDEFAVIMTDVSQKHRITVEKKLNGLKKNLQDTGDGLPAVTMSIGVAFSDRKKPGDSIFNDADLAMYSVKKNGRNGYSFYNDSHNI